MVHTDVVDIVTKREQSITDSSHPTKAVGGGGSNIMYFY